MFHESACVATRATVSIAIAASGGGPNVTIGIDLYLEPPPNRVKPVTGAPARETVTVVGAQFGPATQLAER